MSNSSLGQANDDQDIVSSAEIQAYRDALLHFLVNFKNARSTEELNQLKELVAALSSVISDLRELGITYNEIACRLKSEGLVIDGDTLQDMYYEHRERVTKEFVQQMRFERPAEDAIKKLRESSGQAAATGRTEAKPMVAPAPASAPSPAPATTGDSGSDGSALAATPPARPVKGTLPDPTATQVAQIRDHDLNAILNNVIDVSKIPKRED